MTGGKWINHREHAESESRPPGHEMMLFVYRWAVFIKSGGLYYVYEKTGQELKENAYPGRALLSVKAKMEKQLSLLILSWAAVQTAATVFL